MPPSIAHSLAWAGYKFTSTVLDDIWPQALFFTGIATMVECVTRFTSVDLSMNSQMLTVLGTVVSLVVSFKTNNSYVRWWEGRNVWSNIGTNSRQLAMLIWIQVPNTLPKKDDKDEKDDKKKDKDEEKDDIKIKAQKKKDKRSSGEKRFSNTSSLAPPTSSADGHSPNWHKKGNHEEQDLSAEPLLASSSRDDMISDDDTEEKKHRDEAKKKRVEAKRKAKEEQEILEGLIEKKTYIGLIQAFAVAMKHGLRGEKGPFYSDLYNLIAFLPKYNPAACPPIVRDNLMVLWQNGIPRQKWHSSDDVFAVPLTQPAAFDGYSFDILEGTAPPTPGPTDKESNPSGLTTTSSRFKRQAVKTAARYVEAEDPKVVGFCQLDKGDHRMHRENSPPDEKDKVTITTVELMPPRHPPAARFWDFFPPLRIIKIAMDYFKTQQRLEEQERTQGGKRKRREMVKSEIPQEILMYLSAYVSDLAKREQINTSFISPILTAINELQKAISDLDKIATTPIPSAYSFHLRLTVWAYLFFLPFQLHDTLGWVTIPATAVASITYLGFLEIGAQIEMPFGYEQSDLDLDKFVMKISNQLAEVTAFPTSLPTKSVVLSHVNQPFLPSLSLSATELLGKAEPKLNPNTMGFASAYPEEKKAKKDSDDSDDDDDDDSEDDQQRRLPPARSVRDIEMALNANWREYTDETKKFLGRQRDQLENRTGMEVAVLAL